MVKACSVRHCMDGHRSYLVPAELSTKGSRCRVYHTYQCGLPVRAQELTLSMFESLCDFGDMTPHTLIGGAQTKFTRHGKGQRSGADHVETTPGRPGDPEGTPIPAPQRLWTGARGHRGRRDGPQHEASPGLVYTRLTSPAGKPDTSDRRSLNNCKTISLHFCVSHFGALSSLPLHVSHRHLSPRVSLATSVPRPQNNFITFLVSHVWAVSVPLAASEPACASSELPSTSLALLSAGGRAVVSTGPRAAA